MSYRDSNLLQNNYIDQRESLRSIPPNFPFESKHNIDKYRSTSSIYGLLEIDAPQGLKFPSNDANR